MRKQIWRNGNLMKTNAGGGEAGVNMLAVSLIISLLRGREDPQQRHAQDRPHQRSQNGLQNPHTLFRFRTFTLGFCSFCTFTRAPSSAHLKCIDYVNMTDIR